jgi:hypothetical protein
MAWLLLVVPMVELNLKRLEEIEHLIASFREKKVRTINYDLQPVISISQRYELIQELNPCKIAIRCMLKSKCDGERICESSRLPPALQVIPVSKFDTYFPCGFNLLF